jgi:hypothetical protein
MLRVEMKEAAMEVAMVTEKLDGVDGVEMAAQGVMTAEMKRVQPIKTKIGALIIVQGYYRRVTMGFLFGTV